MKSRPRTKGGKLLKNQRHAGNPQIVVQNSTHHFSTSFFRNLHFLKHLVSLFHQQGAFVSVVRDVRIVHLDDLDVGLDPTNVGKITYMIE
jgi:hypothetical protein